MKRYILACLMLLPLTLLAASPKVVAVDAGSQSITIALTQEPPNLDSTRTTDLVSFFVLGHVNEGLVRYDRRGRLAPGVAERWETAPGKITFYLRRNARWSNGSPVTAEDFVYGWGLINDPASSAPYASIMYPIKNARQIQKGEAPLAGLGVKAIDEHTLEVQLENACGYCIPMMTHAAFFPVNKAFHQARGDQYGAEADTILYNGPFKLTRWVHGAELDLEKNPHYWNKDAISLNRIHVGYITEDNRTRLNLFRDESIALARLGAETVRDAAEQGLKLRTFQSGGMAYLRFNLREDRLTRHPKVRQAIARVFDPDEFVNKVIAIPGYRPAFTFFPAWLNGVDDKFVREYPQEKVPVNVKQARELLAEALQELSVEEVPALTLLTVTSPTGAKIAEYFQGLLKQQLGLDIKVDQQIFKQYIDKTNRGLFDISLASWYPDFDDIVTYADLLASWNQNNRGRYASAEYDGWLEVLMGSFDPRERMAAAARLQGIIARDVPVLPMAETGSAYVQHPRLRGVVRRVLGADPDYTYARVLPE